ETGNFKDVKKLYDVKLTPKMNFTLKTAVLYDGAEDDTVHNLGEWLNGVYRGDEGNTGKKHYYSKNTEAYLKVSSKAKNQLNKNNNYNLSMYMKADSNTETAIEVWGKNGKISEKNVKLNNEGYQRVDMLVSNLPDNPMEEIFIQGNGDITVRWDDVSITEISSINPTSQGIFEIAPYRRTDGALTWKEEGSYPIVLEGNKDEINQKWLRTYDENKKAFQFKSIKDPNKVLTYEQIPNSNEGKLINTENMFEDDQYWTLEKSILDGYYFIKNKETPHMVIDVDKNNTGDGTPVKVAQQHDNNTPYVNAQLFKIVRK
ncbi:RICIN domain-containing protein, partial [Bacillus mycoides]|uniref:RICIN domain-containing protein n=1 Tax=Bacillus mycoides TaxID=1405 RepID=UPI003D6620CE